MGKESKITSLSKIKFSLFGKTKSYKIFLDKIEIIENNITNIDLRNNFLVNYNQGNLIPLHFPV